MSKEVSGLFKGTSGEKNNAIKIDSVGKSGKTDSQIKNEANLIISSLPKNPSTLLKIGWTETTPTKMKQNTDSQTFHDTKTGFNIRFDKGATGANGFKGKDHYHIENPNAIGKGDKYLDKNGNPCAKGSKASHIIP